MGIRGHIETTQPSYDDGACFSSWAKDQARDFLEENGFNIWDNNGQDDAWEIDIDDNLKTVVGDLCEGKIGFDEKFRGSEMENMEYSKSLGSFLKVGLEVAKAKGYTTIRIDWF